jgi:predicted amidohydrolase
MKDNVCIAIIQGKPYSELDDPRNVGHAIRLLEQFRGKGVDIACLPACFPWSGEEALAEVVRGLRCYLVAGLLEATGGKRFSTATLFDRRGRIVGRQRQVHVGVVEQEHREIVPGDGVYHVFDTDFGRLGLSVGIDFWGQPDAARALTEQGADLIVNPSIFPILHGHWKHAALVRAFENFIPVVGVNTAGFNSRIGGRVYHHHGGKSFIIQPPRLVTRDDFRIWFRSLDDLKGWITVELDRREQVALGEVDLATGRRFRADFRRQLGIQRPQAG